VIGLLLGHNGMMLNFKVFLKPDVLPIGRTQLNVKDLIFNGFEMARGFGLAATPSLEIFAKEKGF